MAENRERERDDRGSKIASTRAKQSKSKGFHLTHKPSESEESKRNKEHKDVKVKA